jgi:hypothetical protein
MVNPDVNREPQGPAPAGGHREDSWLDRHGNGHVWDRRRLVVALVVAALSLIGLLLAADAEARGSTPVPSGIGVAAAPDQTSTQSIPNVRAQQAARSRP